MEIYISNDQFSTQYVNPEGVSALTRQSIAPTALLGRGQAADVEMSD
jgi:hypothetical protein